MFTTDDLNTQIVAMVSLASGIAANHPAMGQCQLAKLRASGVSEAQIETVIEIARHIRDEASEKLDAAFDIAKDKNKPVESNLTDGESCGCSPTPSGQTCC